MTNKIKQGRLRDASDADFMKSLGFDRKQLSQQAQRVADPSIKSASSRTIRIKR